MSIQLASGDHHIRKGAEFDDPICNAWNLKNTQLKRKIIFHLGSKSSSSRVYIQAILLFEFESQIGGVDSFYLFGGGGELKEISIERQFHIYARV